MITQAKIDNLCKQIAKDLVEGKITSYEVWIMLDEIENIKAENNITNENWRN